MTVVAQAVNDLQQGGRALPRLAASAQGQFTETVAMNEPRR
jgi:hypothetical protein